MDREADAEHRLKLAQRRAPALNRVFEAGMPGGRANADLTDWSIAGPAFVLRCASLFGSTMALAAAGRMTDAGLPLRSLFEHTVTFAWIAVDAAAHFPRWLQHDYRSMKAADVDAERTLGQGILTAQERAVLEGKLDSLVSGLPKVPDRASAADDYWGDRIRTVGLKGRHSLRSQYIAYYRHLSAIEHPTLISLGQMAVPRPTTNLASVNFVTSAPALFATTLFITHGVFGWPDAAAVHAVFREA